MCEFAKWNGRRKIKQVTAKDYNCPDLNLHISTFPYAGRFNF